MRTFKLKIFWLFYLFFILFSISLKGQDLFDSLRSNQYANFLYQTRNYKDAISEYERFIFKFKADEEMKCKLIKSYRKSGLPKVGLNRLRDLYILPLKSNECIFKEFIILKIIIENDRVHLDEINNSSLISNDDKIILLSSSLIINKDYEKAKSLINNYNYKSNSTISSLYIYSIDGSQIKYKNPIISGSLSLLLPGSGKIYSGEWQDGLLAFSMIAATGLQSYIGFKKNGIESFSGWFFGTLGFGFYIGNITGSIKSANKYNFKKNEIIRLKVKDILFDL